MTISGFKILIKASQALLLAMLFTAVGPSMAFAAHSCEHVFTAEIKSVPEVFYHRLISKSLTAANAETAVVNTRVVKLSEVLFQENSNAVEQGRVYNPIRLSDFTVESAKLMPGKNLEGYGLFIVKLRSRIDGDTAYEYVRSNGFAAFLDKSLQFRQENQHDPLVKRYKASYLENESVKIVDQGEVFISSLPEQIHLTRVMHSIEQQQWIQDKPIRVGAFGAKLHFGVNYFKFQQAEPTLIAYSKKQLLEAYRRGDVEVNTYDALPRTEMWTGKIDLEFEVVFNGLKAMESLRPYLKESLLHQPTN